MNKDKRLILPDIKTNYKATTIKTMRLMKIQTHRSMEWNRDFRNGLKKLWSVNF